MVQSGEDAEIASVSDLPEELEPFLAASAPLAHEAARDLCQGSQVDPYNCDWYHGAWLYLRLLDVVSSPTWHDRFYTSELSRLLVGHPDVLISGAADYSLLAYVLAAVDHEPVPRVTVLDLCPTPLQMCQWYAAKVGREISTLTMDVRSLLGQQPQSYDLITADAFLTRFPNDELDQILLAWHGLLRDGGRVVTTVRTSDPLDDTRDDALVQSFACRARDRVSRLPAIPGLSQSSAHDFAHDYAKNMISYAIGSKATVLDRLGEWFSVEHAQEVAVCGELLPATYLQLTLVKE